MTDLELQLFNSDAFLGGNTQHLQTHFILEEARYQEINIDRRALSDGWASSSSSGGLIARSAKVLGTGVIGI